MNKLLVTILATCTSVLSFAQAGWNWPEDVETAKEKNAFYTDLVKSKQFDKAIEPHNWLLEQCPDLNKSLYINGAKIYEGLEGTEQDAAKKAEYQGMAMKMYDERIKYFGEEASVLNRKAFKAYKYYKNDRSKYKEMLDLFDKTFELNGNKTFDNNLMAYMDVVRRYKLSGGELSDEQVIDKYGLISDVISEKQAKGSSDRLVKIQENVDKILTATVTVDCPFVEDKLVPKMRETKDPKMAKKVFQLMLSAKCSDSPAFVEAAEMVYESDPAAGLAKVIAIKYGAAGDHTKANEWYDKAIELSDDNIEKSEIYMSKAKGYHATGQKSSARLNARKALANNPSMKEAYTFIGHLYYGSYQDCRAGVSKVDDRLVFIAAYNQYQKAGDATNMAKAKEQFPSIAEIFELGLSEGQSMTVGCWINETVTLERRPN